MKITGSKLKEIVLQAILEARSVDGRVTRIILEEASGIEKTIAVYSGRFQPFHKGHYHAYKFLVDKFGRDNVFVGTSNKVDGDKSPLNFDEKKAVITSMFDIPEGNVVMIRNPYNPMEIKGKFDEEKTSLVVGVGEKDIDRLGGKYYKPYDEDEAIGFDKRGYVIEVPQLQLKVNGELISGTVVRKSLGSKEAAKMFEFLYGEMDEKIFNMLSQRFGPDSKRLDEAKRITGVTHIEDMKPTDLLNFLKLWSADKTKFEINEKVDGHFYVFGVKDKEFFSGSKTKVVTDEDDFPSLYFYEDFVKYHKLLKSIDYSGIVAKHAKRFGITGDLNNIKIESESIPSWDYNIVLYNPEKIGDGIVVIFRIIVDGQKTPVEFHEVFANEVNKVSPIKFYANPKVNLDKVHFEESYEVELGAMIEKYGNILSKPARKPHQKEIKQKVKSFANEIGKKLKGKILSVDFERAFGKEDEGLMFYVPDGNVIKVVDKDRFTTRKEANWKYINMLMNAEKRFTGLIKKDPENLTAHLSELDDSVTKIEEDFESSGGAGMTIQKKIDDTRGNLDITKNRVRKMKRLMKSKKHDDVISMYINRELD